MAYFPGLDDEQDDTAPVDTLAGPQTKREQVIQRISEIRNPSQSDDGRDSALEFARSNAMASGIGRGLNSLAAGTGFKADDGAFDALDKQSNMVMNELNRSEKVKQAIEARKIRDAQVASNDAFNREKFGETKRHNKAMELATASKLGTKQEEKDLQLAVPGYERTGEVLPKVEEAQKFRKATADAEQLNIKLKRLKELVESKGSFEWGGPEGQEMESLATEIQLLAKSPSMYELGVLAGPDMNLLTKITADPASLSSLFSRDSTRKTQIDAQMKSIQDKLGSTARSLGYTAKNAPVSPPPPGGKDDGGLIPNAHAGGAQFTDKDVIMFKKAKERLKANPNDVKAQQVYNLGKSKGLQ